MRQIKRLVLCVEPTEDIRSMMQALLGSRGFEADSSATVADAVGKAGSRDYCLYVVDDGYVDGTNVELIRRLRSLTPTVPVLVFCTQDFAHKRSEALQAGAAATTSSSPATWWASWTRWSGSAAGRQRRRPDHPLGAPRPGVLHTAGRDARALDALDNSPRLLRADLSRPSVDVEVGGRSRLEAGAADGSFPIPETLRPYMGVKKIESATR